MRQLSMLERSSSFWKKLHRLRNYLLQGQAEGRRLTALSVLPKAIEHSKGIKRTPAMMGLFPFTT